MSACAQRLTLRCTGHSRAVTRTSLLPSRERVSIAIGWFIIATLTRARGAVPPFRLGWTARSERFLLPRFPIARGRRLAAPRPIASRWTSRLRRPWTLLSPGSLSVPWSIAARHIARGLADPRFPLRARTCRFGLPRPVVGWRRFVAPGLAGARLRGIEAAASTCALVRRTARLSGALPRRLRRARAVAPLAVPGPVVCAGCLLVPTTLSRWPVLARAISTRFARGFIAPRRRLGGTEAAASACAMIGRATACLVRSAHWRPRRNVAGLVAIALRRRILLRPRALGAILFLESIPRILVRAARPPVRCRGALPLRDDRLAARSPRRAPACEVENRRAPLRAIPTACRAQTSAS